VSGVNGVGPAPASAGATPVAYTIHVLPPVRFELIDDEVYPYFGDDPNVAFPDAGRLPADDD
jgi:hypothetical protein